MQNGLAEQFYHTLQSCTYMPIIFAGEGLEIGDELTVFITVSFDGRFQSYTNHNEEGCKVAVIDRPKDPTEVIKLFIEFGIFEINKDFITTGDRRRLMERVEASFLCFKPKTPLVLTPLSQSKALLTHSGQV